MRQMGTPEVSTIEEVRRLTERLAKAVRSGAGTRLTARDVDIALAALRIRTATASPPNIKIAPEMYQIELIDQDGWPVSTLAVIEDESVARAAFEEAISHNDSDILRLRVGAQILCQYP